jgi:catechol 2,3-dioxygenase-like lactoylglutathione lyase family enzyme
MGGMPAQDLERARSFYETRLGLVPVEVLKDEVRYRVGGADFYVFLSLGRSSGDHTQLGFEVDDLDASMKALRDNDVVFEEYDLPGYKTVDGVWELDGERAAWFKDSEGNVIALGEVS